MPICTSYSAMLPTSLPSKYSTHIRPAPPFVGRIALHIFNPLLQLSTLEAHWTYSIAHPSHFAFWGCFQKTRSNVASLTGTGLGSGLWELQGRQLFHIRDWGGRHRCMRQGAPDRVC